MATITQTVLSFDGAAAPLQLVWRTSSPRTALPAVLIVPDPTHAADVTFPDALATRLARAGFHVLTVTRWSGDRADLAPLLAALRARDGRLPPHSSLGIVWADAAGAVDVELPGDPGRAPTGPGVDAVTHFLVSHLD